MGGTVVSVAETVEGIECMKVEAVVSLPARKLTLTEGKVELEMELDLFCTVSEAEEQFKNLGGSFKVVSSKEGSLEKELPKKEEPVEEPLSSYVVKTPGEFCGLALADCDNDMLTRWASLDGQLIPDEELEKIWEYLRSGRR